MRSVLTLCVAFILTSASPSRADTLPDTETASHIGQTVTVEGIVKGTPTTVNRTQFLDFGNTYPNQDFSAEISKADAGQFPPVSEFNGKRVQVTGTITLYHGKPEMILTGPDRLKVLP